MIDKTKETKETIDYFLNQFDKEDPKTQIILDLLFKVIYNIKDDIDEEIKK